MDKLKIASYDLEPTKTIHYMEGHAFEGYEMIQREIIRLIEEGKRIFVFDFYPGVREEEVEEALQRLNPNLIIHTRVCVKSPKELDETFRDYVTNEPVFGVMCYKKLIDYFDKEELKKAQRTIQNSKDGIVFILGTGAGLFAKADSYFYFDLTRWEIQTRYKNGMSNWMWKNETAPFQEKYKRGFFIEWRLADRHKKLWFDKMDYVVYTNIPNQPKMITGDAFRSALRRLSHEPFRLVPYFDPGIWGAMNEGKVQSTSRYE